MILKGEGASKGCGLGTAVILNTALPNYSAVINSGAESEKKKLAAAIDKYIAQTKQQIEKIQHSVGEQEAAIPKGHLAILNDEELLTQMKDRIDDGAVAEAAVDTVFTAYCQLFAGLEDETMRLRAADMADIRDSLLRLLLGVDDVDVTALPQGSILVVKELTPSMASRLNSDNVVAIVAETGGRMSHSAILARTMGIPAVFSAENALSEIQKGQKLLVDGFRGEVILQPTKAQIISRLACSAEVKNEKGKDDQLSKIKIYGNIERAEDAKRVLVYGGDGVGLFRTEYLFMNRGSEPTEQEQYEAYAAVTKTMQGRETVIRTLDIGGDKRVPYLPQYRSANPLLGIRGIRYCLCQKSVFQRQIRAVLRAAIHGNVKLLLPFVTSVDEVKEAKRIIKECADSLQEKGIAFQSVPVGVMIETPSAAILSDCLAKEADFFSIGTNDLTALMMAADRESAAVGQLYDVMQPAVLRAIEMTVTHAKANGIPVSICGEAATDERLLPLLKEWKVDVLSVSSPFISQIRNSLCEQ